MEGVSKYHGHLKKKIFTQYFSCKDIVPIDFLERVEERWEREKERESES